MVSTGSTWVQLGSLRLGYRMGRRALFLGVQHHHPGQGYPKGYPRGYLRGYPRGYPRGHPRGHPHFSAHPELVLWQRFVAILLPFCRGVVTETQINANQTQPKTPQLVAKKSALKVVSSICQALMLAWSHDQWSTTRYGQIHHMPGPDARQLPRDTQHGTAGRRSVPPGGAVRVQLSLTPG